MKIQNSWWLVLAAGLIFILIGAFALISPLNAYLMMVQYSGITLLVNGVLLILVSFSSKGSLREKEWMVTESILDFIFGAILLFNPFLSFIAFPFLIGSWIMGKGFLQMVASFTIRSTSKGWLFVLATGVIGIVFGILIMYNPLVKASGITVFIGGFGVIIGAVYVFDAFRYRKLEDGANIIL